MSILEFLGTSHKQSRTQALGDVADFINERLDETGITGERNIGYRVACMDITAKILELLKDER